MEQLVTCLWFDNEAEEAAQFYTSIFEKSKIGGQESFSEVGQEHYKKDPGSTMTVEFELRGQKFLSLNGGPNFKFNEAISIVVNCNGKKEVDYFWDKLFEDGDPNAQQCGWLKDKYGLSWQIIPKKYQEFISHPEKSVRDSVLNPENSHEFSVLWTDDLQNPDTKIVEIEHLTLTGNK